MGEAPAKEAAAPTTQAPRSSPAGGQVPLHPVSTKHPVRRSTVTPVGGSIAQKRQRTVKRVTRVTFQTGSRQTFSAKGQRATILGREVRTVSASLLNSAKAAVDDREVNEYSRTHRKTRLMGRDGGGGVWQSENPHSRSVLS